MFMVLVSTLAKFRVRGARFYCAFWDETHTVVQY